MRALALGVICVALFFGVIARAQQQGAFTPTDVSGIQKLERRVGTIPYASLTSSNGFVYAAWNYGYTFNDVPKCFATINSQNDTVTFSLPITTVKTTTAVTFKFRVLPITLSIALGSLTLGASTPTDTTVDILCVNPI